MSVRATKSKERVAVITGPTSGIGKVTAQVLAKEGMHLILVCRDKVRAESTASELTLKTCNGNIATVIADLTQLSQTRAAANAIRNLTPSIDLLINNAGILPGKRRTTSEGYEESFCVNHLSPFLLTNLLLDRLVAARDSRIVNVSSDLHKSVTIPWDDLTFKKRYSPYYAYSVGKLANLMVTFELASRLRKKHGCRVAVNALHPGIIRSNFGGKSKALIRTIISIAKPFLSSPEKGARTVLYASLSQETCGLSGEYFKNSKIGRPAAEARVESACARMWDVSERMACSARSTDFNERCRLK